MPIEKVWTCDHVYFFQDGPRIVDILRRTIQITYGIEESEKVVLMKQTNHLIEFQVKGAKDTLVCQFKGYDVYNSPQPL